MADIETRPLAIHQRRVARNDPFAPARDPRQQAELDMPMLSASCLLLGRLSCWSCSSSRPSSGSIIFSGPLS
jgi:hypothetical protein